jgi:hypothetical protein
MFRLSKLLHFLSPPYGKGPGETSPGPFAVWGIFASGGKTSKPVGG